MGMHYFGLTYGISYLSFAMFSVGVLWNLDFLQNVQMQEKIYLDNLEASVIILRKLSDEWKVHSLKHTNLDVPREILKLFRQKVIFSDLVMATCLNKYKITKVNIVDLFLDYQSSIILQIWSSLFRWYVEIFTLESVRKLCSFSSFI